MRLLCGAAQILPQREARFVLNIWSLNSLYFKFARGRRANLKVSLFCMLLGYLSAPMAGRYSIGQKCLYLSYSFRRFLLKKATILLVLFF